MCSHVDDLHYDNMPMQYNAIIHGCNMTFFDKNVDSFLIFALKH